VPHAIALAGSAHLNVGRRVVQGCVTITVHQAVITPKR
jgi:hypothetical protein